MYSVYIVECWKPKHVYVGLTSNVKRRMQQHKSGHGSAFVKLHKFRRHKVIWDGLTKEEALSVELKVYGILRKQGLEVRGAYNCRPDGVVSEAALLYYKDLGLIS